jgi:hypothetical protein
MPGVTVAEEGNARKGEMGSDELKQCIMDIQGWFSRNGGDVDARATTADLQKLSKGVDAPIPDNLEMMLGEVNGGFWFMDKKGMSVEGIVEAAVTCEGSGKWRSGLVPFAGDEGGMLVIDTKTNKVLEWDEDDGVGDAVANSFEDYLETFRNTIMAGKCEFDNDIGVIEGVSGGSRK